MTGRLRGSRRRDLRSPRAGRAGGILLETMLALALFVATGSLVLGVMTDCTRAIARAERLASAVDCARSLMAEFEAGLRPMGDLAGGELEELPPPWEDFRVEARTRRSDFEGLVLAEIGVFEAGSDGAASASIFALRQLLPARGVDVEALEDFDSFEDLAQPPRSGERPSLDEDEGLGSLFSEDAR
ncbi:MAG: hypothetical protein ACO38W_01675 [Phycisphaerales bacterium]